MTQPVSPDLPEPVPAKCGAPTKFGWPCEGYRVRGTDRCVVHGGEQARILQARETALRMRSDVAAYHRIVTHHLRVARVIVEWGRLDGTV